jgi:protein-S-isoprenylcysteine O-methyltransferase Ste14
MKGIEKLREKLPDYTGKRIYRFSIIAIVTFTCSLIFQIGADSLPRLLIQVPFMQFIAPFTPVLGPLLIVTIGLLIVYKFWRVREKQLEKFHDRAYQKSFKYVAVGIPMVFSVIAHSFIPLDLLVSFNRTRNLTWYLATPLTSLLPDAPVAFLYIRLILFLIFFLIGVNVMIKTLKVFGIDYMALVYVYYPSESKLQNHEIYSILRHPTYHALALLCIGNIFLRFSIYSIIYFLIFMIGINIHLKYVEEKELISRFGDSYRKYRKEVPAFFVKLKDLKKYFRFILR